jgi:Serine/Threonine/Tyrosine Kinase found in polyvalent proteins
LYEKNKNTDISRDCGQHSQDREQTAASDFIAILGARAREITSEARNIRRRIGGSQVRSLRKLAKSNRFTIHPPKRTADKFGAEHNVYLSDDGSRVMKFAKNYGFIPAVVGTQIVMKTATPYDYLQRLALAEIVFPTGTRVEGITKSGTFVISQRAIKGSHPAEDVIRKYLLKLGFVNVPPRFGQGGRAWYRVIDKIFLLDTAPDNFIRAAQGIVPIDLMITESKGKFRKVISAVEKICKQSPKIDGVFSLNKNTQKH